MCAIIIPLIDWMCVCVCVQCQDQTRNCWILEAGCTTARALLLQAPHRTPAHTSSPLLLALLPVPSLSATARWTCCLQFACYLHPTLLLLLIPLGKFLLGKRHQQLQNFGTVFFKRLKFKSLYIVFQITYYSPGS